MGQPAAAAFTIGSAVVQAKQQKALGKYNQQVSERNAQIAEQEANQIGQQAEFDIARFDQKFRQAEGAVAVAVAKSGAVAGSGTAARIAESNALEAQMERKITRYNADMGAAKKIEEAQFSRIQGQMARAEARIANIQTAAKAGSSLLQIYAPNSIYNTPTTTGTKIS
jgi:hypothetical protein